MMAATGIAYRVQPDDEMHEDQTLMHRENERLNEELCVARAEVNGVRAWEHLSATEKVRLIAKSTNGDCPPDDELAELVGCHRSTVSRARKGLEDTLAA